MEERAREERSRARTSMGRLLGCPWLVQALLEWLPDDAGRTARAVARTSRDARRVVVECADSLDVVVEWACNCGAAPARVLLSPAFRYRLVPCASDNERDDAALAAVALLRR